MPTPTIPDGELFFNATTYTGNGGTQTINNGVAGQSFAPDFVWIKDRTNANNHILSNSVTDPSGWRLLQSNNTNAEIYSNLYITSLNSNGFSLALTGDVNASGVSYVAWQWKAGGAAVTNTAGSISSQVSANTTSGFSVVTYTGNGTGGATVGHGLGVAPSMFFIKRRNASGNNWAVYHASANASPATGGMNLDTAVAFTADSAWFNNTAPTSTVFSIGTSGIANASGGTYVAYCWAPIAGYSAMGSYTGNGSSDGPFVYTGFRPKFVLLKSSTQATDWYIYDTSRDTYNLATLELNPNLAAAEQNGTYGSMDINSNGFKLRFAGGEVNVSGQTYIYMAFCENPLKYANAR